MIDTRADSIIYQSQIYYRELVNDLTDKKKVGKALDSKWDKADNILGYLEAWNHVSKLTEEQDIINANFILYCLIELCELNQYPNSAPLTFSPAPDILTGIPGEDGEKGDTGERGDTGLATDFQISLVSVPTVVDSFPITDADGARWDYYIVNQLGAQRVSSILGHWLPDGSNSTLADLGADDLNGSTDSLEFSLQISGGFVQLIATPISNTWTVKGSRYFIPNNGNGSGPISDALLNGQIFVGNTLNLAQGRTPSGDITMDNAGVFSYTPLSITNADISTSANIELVKLESLTPNRLLLSNGVGKVSASTITNIEAGHLTGISSNIQTQLNQRLIDPMTTIGDIVIRNGLNVSTRLGIGTANQILTVVGGVPTWSNPPGGIVGLTTGFITKATSATTIGNSIITETGPNINIAGTLSVATSLAGAYLVPNRVILSTSSGVLIVSTVTTTQFETLFADPVINNLVTTPPSTEPYQVLMSNSDNTGYEFIGLATLKELLNNI